MNRKYVMEAVQGWVIDTLKDTGFSRKIRQLDGIQKRTKEGLHVISVGVVDYQPIFKFSLSLCIRIDAVEEVKCRILKVPDRYAKQSMTTFTQVEYFGISRDDHHFEVRSESELYSALDYWRPFLSEKAVPFFHKLETIEQLNCLLNSGRPAELGGSRSGINRLHFFNSMIEPYCSMSAVTVAYAAKDMRFIDIVGGCRKRLGDNEAHIAQFDEYLNGLE